MRRRFPASLLAPVVFLAAFALASARCTPAAAQAEPLSWATAQAGELTRQGRDLAARREIDAAASRFLEAIKFDATYGPAYLGLGALHEQGGDPREAERAYAMGLERVPRFVEGFRARSRLYLRQGRHADAIADARAAVDLVPDGLEVVRELAAVYVAAGALPAALAVTRRIEVLAEAQGELGALVEARVRARALGILVAELDPVLSGGAGRGAVRRAIALRARSGAGTRSAEASR